MSTCTDCIKIDVFERERDAAIANLAKAEARITEAHAALDEAGVSACDGVLSGRITALAADRDQANRFLDSAVKERDSLRADLTEAGNANSRLAVRLVQPQAENAPLRAALEEANAAHAILDAAKTPPRGFIAGRVTALVTERDTLRAEVETLRARLAERPAPADPRDPPVKTSEEEAIERLWGALFTLGGGINRADFEGGIEGIADAVEDALGYNLAQIRKLTTERDRMESIALEQFRRRLSGA